MEPSLITMKAIALVSGGLDSTLAAKITQDLGIELIALNTVSPFCLCNHRSPKGCIYAAHQTAKNLGLKLVSINTSDEFLELVKKPKYGYGSNMNPCIDCRILLFKKAKEIMQKESASFVITGEVLAQRPMSQRLGTMKLIEKEAGLEGLVLRPLSARVLEPTFPERQGWVQRDKLLAISGRGRKEQISLAKNLGINDYPCPSGGCLLTDPGFAKRLKDLMQHEGLSLEAIQLLKVGRHFRISETAKLIVGRNESENTRLVSLAKESDYLFFPDENTAGPASLGRGIFNDELIKTSCSITCRYCDLNGALSLDIGYKKGAVPAIDSTSLRVSPMQEDKLISFRI